MAICGHPVGWVQGVTQEAYTEKEEKELALEQRVYEIREVFIYKSSYTLETAWATSYLC